MEFFHRHNDLELNYIEHGAVTYLFGGSRVTFHANELAVFWAAMPHRLLEAELDSKMHWLEMPLVTFLDWSLPVGITSLLLGGHILIDCDSAVTCARPDLASFTRWRDDLSDTHDEESCRIVLLELEARLRRLARTQTIAYRSTRNEVAGHAVSANMSKAEQMALFISKQFADPLTSEDVAAHVKLHPKYAMQLFRQKFSLTIVDYLTQQRVAHAQQLLVTTDQDVLDVAMACGFGSLSRFYAAFKEACGIAPRAYRESLYVPHLANDRYQRSVLKMHAQQKVLYLDRQGIKNVV